MTDRPIIFSAPMVRALLDGRKTQTRRLLKIKGRKGFFQFGRSDLPDYDWTFRRADHVWEDWKHGQLLRKLPYAPGDRLWVREAFRGSCGYDGIPPAQWGNKPIWYVADGEPGDHWGFLSERRRPSIHMPRWASRLTLAVTDVRVQRLQDISEDDAVAEGAVARRHTWWQGFVRRPDGSRGMMETGGAENPPPAHFENPEKQTYERSAVSNFRSIWNSLHGPDAWGENPWVVAITFDVHRCNIDTLDRSAAQ